MYSEVIDIDQRAFTLLSNNLRTVGTIKIHKNSQNNKKIDICSNLSSVIISYILEDEKQFQKVSAPLLPSSF